MTERAPRLFDRLYRQVAESPPDTVRDALRYAVRVEAETALSSIARNLALAAAEAGLSLDEAEAIIRASIDEVAGARS